MDIKIYQAIYDNGGHFVDVREGEFEGLSNYGGEYNSDIKQDQFKKNGNFNNGIEKVLRRENNTGKVQRPNLQLNSHNDVVPFISHHSFETNIFSLNKEHQQRPSNKQLGYEKNEEELTTSEEKHLFKSSETQFSRTSNLKYGDFREDFDQSIIPFSPSISQCFKNAKGFICCNHDLFALIEEVSLIIESKNYSICNMQIIAHLLQQKAQKKLGSPFEVIVSPSDFASKSHFVGNMLCKNEINGRYILIYGTPEEYDYELNIATNLTTPVPFPY
ncbi:unnamed protein product [Dracunculus medinensis]|uniref:Ground-like domain-containing protein n=1 Tax=Dracunculus medinensis TaxID=318479 RepID=A0A0N4U0U3_DRAME|nr:unnamed protein product [Dracunculus medinensis]